MKLVHSKVWLLLTIILVAFAPCKGKTPRAELSLEKDTFSPGEVIKVKYIALPEYDESAWIGMIPSAIKHGSESLNDQHDITYKYLKKSTAGEMSFTAPVTPGFFDLRMNDTDKNGVEVAFVTFKVVGPPPPAPAAAPAPAPAPAAPAPQAGAKLTLAQTTFAPGETIKLNYVALPTYASNGWIGIIPSHVAHGNESENDRHDIAYKYLKKSTSGEMTFTAPSNPGNYDFRMHDTDNNGIEVASVTFAVVAATAEPAPKAKKFNVGDSVLVEWKGSWWPAQVIALREGNSPYKIHYDGYSKSWDEWVGDARIRGR